MIQILLLIIIGGRTQKLLKTFELNANDQISGIINVEKLDENLLIVFYFDNANNPIALASKEEILETDFNTTVKPTFIESKKDILFDYESIQTHYHTHIIQIEYEKSIYYYARDRFGPLKLKIEVYSKPHSTCINECQGFQISKTKQKSYCNTKCECETGYFGSYCQFELINIKKDLNYKIHLIPHKAVYLSFKFDQEAILIADDVIDPITASFGLLGYKDLEIPDQTSNTAILHSQLSLSKLIQNFKQSFKDASTLIIGLQCRTDQTIIITLKQEQTVIWSGNCMFVAFASFNIILMIFCFGITKICKHKTVVVKKKRKLQIRPPKLEDNPKNFSGSFFNKYFEIYDFEDFRQMNPQFNQNIQCVVCMEDLSQKEVSITPCGHVFHHQCLKKWLMRILNCPSCRFHISYQKVIEGGWLGSKIQNSSICQQQYSNTQLMIHRCNSFIENNDNFETVEKGEEN